MDYALLVLVQRNGVQRLDLDLGTTSMADDDGSRRPSQPSTPVNPAGVGSSASNRGSPHGMVSPSILREILESGNQGLIDDAFEQWDAADMGRLLSTLPSPARSSPAGVGSAASNRSSPSPAVPRTPTGVQPALVVTEEAEGPPLRQGPPAVDAARLPREESVRLPP